MLKYPSFGPLSHVVVEYIGARLSRKCLFSFDLKTSRFYLSRKTDAGNVFHSFVVNNERKLKPPGRISIIKGWHREEFLVVRLLNESY